MGRKSGIERGRKLWVEERRKAVIMCVLMWNVIQTIYPTLLRKAKVPATKVAAINYSGKVAVERDKYFGASKKNFFLLVGFFVWKLTNKAGVLNEPPPVC